MTDLKIELEKVECYIVVAKATGQKSGLMQVKSSWNGMMELTSVLPGNGTMIIDTPERNGFSGGMFDIFPNNAKAPIEGAVVKISSDLLLHLFASKDATS
jgi:hypothetical protein